MLFSIYMYKVSFYTPSGKTSPIKEYLDSTNESVKSKILRQLKYVQEFGLTPPVPNLRKLTNTSLWEARILGKDNIRIICASLPNREIKILHIFSKKKPKTPQKEISLAVKRYKEVTQRSLDN